MDHGRTDLVVTIKMNKHGIIATVQTPRAKHDLCGSGSRRRKGLFKGRDKNRLIKQVCEYVASSLIAGGNPYWNMLKQGRVRRMKRRHLRSGLLGLRRRLTQKR